MIVTLIQTILYVVSLTGPFYYYGSIRSGLYKIPSLILIVLGAIFFGYGIGKLSQNFKINISMIEGAILIFFIVKLIMNLWMCSILSSGAFTVIGWIVWKEEPVFRYYIINDIIWCLSGIAYVITSINESNKKVRINVNWVKL